jgi:hypothetical protein
MRTARVCNRFFMSNVTNIILSASLFGVQDMFRAQLDAYTAQLNVPPFVKLDNCLQGGDKCLRADLFVAGFSNLDLTGFIHFFKSLHYAYKGADQKQTLQLFIKRPEDKVFLLFTQDTISQWSIGNRH